MANVTIAIAKPVRNTLMPIINGMISHIAKTPVNGVILSNKIVNHLKFIHLIFDTVCKTVDTMTIERPLKKDLMPIVTSTISHIDMIPKNQANGASA